MPYATYMIYQSLLVMHRASSWSRSVQVQIMEHFIVELSCVRSMCSKAPWVRKCGNLPIWEILVITWHYLDPSVRTTGILVNVNNSINWYGNPNATQGSVWKEIAWPPRLLERKNNNKVMCFSTLFFMFTLAWITEKESARASDWKQRRWISSEEKHGNSKRR